MFIVDLFGIEVAEEHKGETKYEEISKKIKAKEYDNIIKLCTQEIDEGDWNFYRLFSLNSFDI